jgi:outer membrane autotransporter protein
MQRVQVDEGTLEINDDYQLADGGTFQTKVYGGGDSGQLKINGEAGLAGTLKVVKGPGAYVNGAKYNVLVADTTTDWFSDEIMPEPTALVSFRANGYPDRVEVEPLVKSFTTVANNRVHRTIGQYMDRILPTASGDLSYVLGEFQNLSGQQINTAFSSLSPDSYDSFTTATFGSTWQYTKSLQQRMNTVRSYSRTAGSDLQTKPILLAYSGSDASLGQFFTPGQPSQVQGKNGLWFNAFGQWGNQDEEEDGFTGFDYDLWGTTLGFDHTFGDKLMAGLSLGYSGTDIDLDSHLGYGDIKNLFGSLYGSYFNKNAYIEAAFSYGRNWYDNSRLVMIGPIQRRASSEHDGNVFSGYLGAGYYFNLKDWALGPFGSLRYVYLDEESFRETGAGGVSLWVDKRKTDSLVSELGLQVIRTFGTKYGNLIPGLSLAWSYDFDIDDRVITTSFAGSPGAQFSIEGQDVEKHGVTLGAGLTFVHQSGFSTSLRYSGEFRKGYTSHGIIGELRYTF